MNKGDDSKLRNDINGRELKSGDEVQISGGNNHHRSDRDDLQRLGRDDLQRLGRCGFQGLAKLDYLGSRLFQSSISVIAGDLVLCKRTVGEVLVDQSQMKAGGFRLSKRIPEERILQLQSKENSEKVR